MQDHTTILVPVRYPLTDDSSRTLAAAGRLARERTPADIRILHVNLIQYSSAIQTTELTRATASVLKGVDTSVTTRRGFLVEEVILDEATQIGADVIVVGADRSPRWRRLLRRMIGTEPAIGAFLQDNTPPRTDVIEVDTTATTPAVDTTTSVTHS